jgi:phage baseplate assembly protein W
MSVARYGAWRFTIPRSEDTGKSDGLRVSNRGTVDMVEGAASVRQALLMLLATRPGERVMRPHYGCHLHRLVFSPNDDTTAGIAIHYVRQAIEHWEPRIEVIRLDATRSEDNGSSGLLEITLEYRLRATSQTERLAYAFDLMGERV